MLKRILPGRIDNNYRGHKIGLWLFCLIIFVKTAISLGSVLNSEDAARSADRIPLDSFGAGAADTVISLFMLLGLSHLIFCLLCILVVIRYRAMIPLMYILILLESLCRKWILLVNPIPRSDTLAAFPLGLVLIVIVITGLVFSLRWKPL